MDFIAKTACSWLNTHDWKAAIAFASIFPRLSS